ncbi:MAG: PQQ-dependent sugar dehydrogenase [Bacteroidota bacterium]
MKPSLFILIALALNLSVSAQRGSIPREKTRNKYVTNYPQHIDFQPYMVKQLKVPKGWEVSVVAYGLGKPRMLYAGEPGTLYVTRRDAGDVLLLKDKDGDSKFEELQTVAADFPGVHGITMKDGWMYLCNNNQLRRYKMKPDGTLEADCDTLIANLPNGGQHANRTMDFGPDGMLYLSIGSTCNDCKESDKEMAAMVKIDPSTWKRTIYAAGLRNTIGFDWHPQTKEMWGPDNGSDAKGSHWPPEELNRIQDGVNYGFPYAYGNKKKIDYSREDPSGDSKELVVKHTQGSVMEFKAHSAPIGFRFFPVNSGEIMSGDALVCWHGSWNRSHPRGFKVEWIQFRNGTAVKSKDFVTGFLRPGFLFFRRKARFGRPTGVEITNGGVVYISDDANGVIYAVKKSN